MIAPSPQAAPDRGRDASIDWMRAISILYIVGFWHLHNYTTFVPWYRDSPFARITVLALALFALISGFLAGKPTGTLSAASVGGYYKRRLIRIYPPYLMALTVFTVLGLSGAAFLPSALMLTMIVPPAPYTLWFMTMIVLFYIAAPFMLATADRPIRLIVIVAATWLALFAVDTLLLNLEDRLLIYLPAFTAGMVLASIGRTPPRPQSRRLLLIGSGIAAIAGYAVSMNAPDHDPDQSLWMAPWAIASAIFVFTALRGMLPSSRIMKQLSLGGFFLYLFHRPIYVVVLRLTGVEAPWARELLLVGFCLPVAIAFGIVAQNAYDRLVDKALRWRWKGHEPGIERQEPSG